VRSTSLNETSLTRAEKSRLVTYSAPRRLETAYCYAVLRSGENALVVTSSDRAPHEPGSTAKSLLMT
jgi:hypothetical protein